VWSVFYLLEKSFNVNTVNHVYLCKLFCFFDLRLDLPVFVSSCLISVGLKTVLKLNNAPCGLGRCRISPPRFLAEYCKRQLNQGSFVLLYFRLFTFFDLCWVCLSVFSCTVLFVSISQAISCEDRLRNDLYCVEWGVKLYSNQLKLNTGIQYTCIIMLPP